MSKDPCKKDDHKKKERGSKTSIPLIRNGFAEVYSICNGNTHTLLESFVFPMENLTAEMDNFGDCPVTYHFLTKRGQTIDRTVQPGQELTIQVPGGIILVTATCECTSCGPCASSEPPSKLKPSKAVKANGGYYDFCGFDIYVEYTQCVCC